MTTNKLMLESAGRAVPETMKRQPGDYAVVGWLLGLMIAAIAMAATALVVPTLDPSVQPGVTDILIGVAWFFGPISLGVWGYLGAASRRRPLRLIGSLLLWAVLTVPLYIAYLQQGITDIIQSVMGTIFIVVLILAIAAVEFVLFNWAASQRKSSRFVSRILLVAGLNGVALWAYLDAEILNGILLILSFAFQILFAIAFVIIQFGAIFWFMSRTKVEVIRPGDPKQLTFDDYKGQPNLLRLVRQWISLLSDRSAFQKMGGQFINGILLYGAPGTGKCVVGDTRIMTPWGYHRIDEIHPARTPDTYWPLNLPVGTVDGVKEASHFYIGGKSETLRIRTYHGYELEGTPEHPVMCLRPGGKLEWAQLSQLTTDDYVGIARNIEMWGPDHVEDAYILGILVGDGHIVSGKRVELANAEAEILEKFKAWAEANGWTAHKKTSSRYDWYISSTEAVRKVNRMGLPAVLAQDKSIPDVIWKSDRESVREFLRGLFDADGYAGRDTGYVEFSSSSHQLVKDVQLLLLKFGILSRVTRKPVFHHHKGVRKRNISWKLTMAGRHAALFYERVGFGLTRKQERQRALPTTLNPNDDVVPNIGPLLKGWQPRYVREERHPTYDMLERAVAEADLQHPTLQWLLETRPIWSRVEEITEGEAEVFDITVPDGHAFIANGFISHNTLLAKCMAGEAGVAFVSIEGSGFRAMFWGVDVLRMIWFIRKARNLAREYGACIAYIDEIDAVAMSRGNVMGGQGQMGGMGGMGGFMGGGSGALTRLLYEMDGIGEQARGEKMKARLYRLLKKPIPTRNWHVLFMGSTNRPDVLDPALTRPGRFDRMIQVDKPDRAGRRDIVQYYLNKVKHDESVDIEAIVADTSEATPAQIMSAITKDAVRLALFDGRDKVSQQDVDMAFQEQQVGLENPIEELPEDQRRQIAYHEAGHAVVQHYLMPEERIVRVTIVRRGQALGYMMPVKNFEVYAQPLQRYVRDIMVSMAGHVSTKMFLGEYWTGATGDFMSVRAQIQKLAHYGYFGPPISEPNTLRVETDKSSTRYERFWREAEEQTERLLRLHAAEVEAVAQALLVKESINGRECVEIIRQAAARNGYAEMERELIEALPAQIVAELSPPRNSEGAAEPSPVAEADRQEESDSA